MQRPGQVIASPERETIPKKLWRWTKPFVWLVLVLGVVGLWLLIPEYARVAGATDACPPSPEANPQPPLAKGVVAIPLILEKPEGVTVNLWRDRAIRNKTVFLQASKSEPPRSNTTFATLSKDTTFNVAKRPLERQQIDGNIGPVQYVALAQVTGQKEVGVTVCVDPRGFDADPGTYVGSVRISARSIQPVTVPVSVTLQYTGYRWVVAVIGAVTFVAGSFTVWAAGKKVERKGEAPKSVWEDIGELSGWIADNYIGVVAGAIAAISVFLAKYWRNPAWGANAPDDWFALLGGMYTAYTATLTAATAIVPAHGKSRSAEDQEVHAA